MVFISVFAVIPVKTLLKSKTRLSIVLNPQERQTFTLVMLKDVLTATKYSMVRHTILVSSDPTIKKLADNFGVTYLHERKRGVNQAIKQAIESCIHDGANSVLILPADIPLITPKEINRIIELGLERTSIVISPSQNVGTNALLQNPPNLIPTRFGPQSFLKHCNEASARMVTFKVYRSQKVALDIDSIKDLTDFLEIRSQTASHQFLAQIKLKDRLKNLNPC